MIDGLKKLIFANPATKYIENKSLKSEIVASALMIELALVDGEMDLKERKLISNLLAKRFNIETKMITAIIEEAIEKVDRASDLYGFTRKINQVFNHDERIELIGMLWEVVYADEIVQDFEVSTMRRLTGLLHITDRESGEARKRVLEGLSFEKLNNKKEL